jgi:hypothetical protein
MQIIWHAALSSSKIQWQCYPWASERACVTFSAPFLDKVRSYLFFLWLSVIHYCC